MREVNYTINIIMHRNWILISLLLIGVLLSNSRMLTAQQESVTVIVATQSTNVRANSSTATAIVGTLQTGESAPLIGETTTGEAVNGIALWYQIQLSGNRQGWVWSGAVTQVQVTPTPIPTARPTLVPNPDYQTLTGENLSELREVYRWGRGVPYRVAWSPSGQVALATSDGLLFYNGNDWTQPPQAVSFEAKFSPTWLGGMPLSFAGEYVPVYETTYQRDGSYITTLTFYHPTQPTHVLTFDVLISSIAVPPDQPEHVAVSFLNQRLAVYNIETGDLVRELLPAQGETAQAFNTNYPVAYSVDGEWLAVVQGQAIRLYRRRGTARYQLEKTIMVSVRSGESDFRPRHIAFNASATKLITLGDFQNARIIDLATGTKQNVAVGLPIAHLFLLERDRFAFIAPDRVFQMDAETAQSEVIYPTNVVWSNETWENNPWQDIGDGAFSPDGRQFLTLSETDGTLNVYDTATHELLHHEALSTGYVDMDMSADGRRMVVISGGLDGVNGSLLEVFDLHNEQGVPLLSLHLGAHHLASEVAIHPDGHQVVVGEDWAGVHVLVLRDANTGEQLATTEFGSFDIDTISDGYFKDIAWSPDGTRLLIGSHEGRIRLWDVARWQAITNFLDNPPRITDVAYSPDGLRFAVASAGEPNSEISGAVNQYDAEGRHLLQVDSAMNTFHSVAYSRDGHQLHTVGSFSQTCGYYGCNPIPGNIDARKGTQLWDTTSGELLSNVGDTNFQYGKPYWGIFSPDDSQLLIRQWLGHIRIYDVLTQQRITNRRVGLSYSTSGEQSLQMRFTPDQSLVIMLNAPTGYISFWGVAVEPPTSTPTSTPSATMTIVPTPSPTATPTVAPSNARFYDDFTQGDLTQWDVTYAADQVEIAEMDGNPVLHLLGNQTDYVSLGFHDSLTDAAILQARVQVIDFGPRDGSFNFNLMSELPGHGTGYSALIGRGGSFLAERNDGFRGLDSFDSRTFTLQTGRWYTIRLEQRGSTLILTVDDEVIHQAHVSNDLSGQPLFIFDAGMELYLDDVWVE